MVTCANCGAEHPEGFEFCPSCGSSLKPAERTAEERKLVTILFADVTGSTELGEQLDPERLRSLLATYFSAMSAAIASWGGTVEKFIGDAIMAVFGVPVVREDDAGRALRAALEMLARLDALNRDFQARHGVTLRIRIGVNTGEVIAPMGAGAQQLIVTGDAVNVAARLEQVAEPGTVLVGERTFLAARDAFRFGEPVPLELKGKAGTITAYPLVEVLPEARRGVPGLSSPMVGRDRELEALTSLFEEAIETNRPRLVTVFGPAGIGKSRLVQEFVRLTSSLRSDATVLRGRCVAAGHGITYWALGEILSAACGIVLDDSADVAEEKLRSGLSEILSALDLRDDELTQTVFALATTAGISLQDNPLERMEPREVADEIGRAWPRFASAYASRAPLVIAVEDLHWAGDQLLDMLERILARSSGPLVLVATARPEFAQSHPAFVAGREDASSISLRPLTPEQGVRLVEGLLTIADIPGELREDLLAKAEGNPFFLEEIIRRLIDEGALVREGDTWRATAAARQTTVPDTIHGLLAARVDGLPPIEKQVLQEAAVVGRVFWEEPVAQTLGNGTVSAALLELERKGLVFTRPTSSIAGQIEFMFKHALVRDVAYASLPKVRRARAHAEHGAWIERLAGDRVDELAELVAYHYGTAASGKDADLAWADDPPQGEAVRVKAVESLLLAGEVARRRYAIDKAVELHEQVRSLARSDRERARGLEELGDDHAAAFHGDEAVESYLESLTLLRPDPAAISARVRLCRKAARMAAEKFGAFRSPPDPSLVDDLIQEGLFAAADDEPRAWLLTLSGESSLYWRAMKGDDPVPMQRRIDSVREALALSERLDQPDLQIFAIRTLSELYEVAGSYELSIETARRQLALLDRVESASERALSLFSVGMGLADLVGEYDEAIELSRQSYELAKGLSSHERMHGLYGQINPLYHLGRWDEVLSLLEEHVEYFRLEADVSCFGVRGGIMFGALTLARRGRVERSMELEAMVPRLDRALRGEGLRALLASATGDHEGARELATDVLARAEATWRAPESALAMLEALAALGLWEELTEHLGHVRNFAGALVTLDPTCDRAEGLIRAAAGDLDAAAGLFSRSLAVFDRLGERYEAARTREALAGVTRTERARDLFTEALGQYEDLGAGPDADRVRALLGKS